MKKVTLLGDSIRMIGYGLKVPELLGEEYDVFQPDDNCRFAKYTLRGLFDWKEQYHLLSPCALIIIFALWQSTESFNISNPAKA